MARVITRRSFLKATLTSTAAFCFDSPVSYLYAKTVPAPEDARFYDRLGTDTVRCRLCFRSCTISEGKRGFCRNRENRKGILYSLVYGQAAAVQLDPIEKEPMYHILPASDILCTGTASCNFRCKFCHNWHLSQRTVEELKPRTSELKPEDIVRIAQKKRAGLSFTYNEPTVFYEYMHDIAKIGSEKGLNTIFHTNGGMRSEPMKALLKHMKGVTVDLKGFTADYYRDVSFASMKPVLKTLELIKGQGKWLEIVNLIVPTLNDNMASIREMCGWIVENLGPDVPVHFIRFFPAYKMMHLPPTPVKTLEEARDIAEERGIRFTYIGNVPGHKHNSTFCPQCKKKIISRRHFAVRNIAIQNSKCQNCGYPVPGIWEH
jgi:pyruvate formate lyase activating enzyme